MKNIISSITIMGNKILVKIPREDYQNINKCIINSYHSFNHEYDP